MKYKIYLNIEDFDFLVNKVRFIFKKEFSFLPNPYMSSLAEKLVKSYNDNYLNVNKKDLDKILFILNLSNLIDKRKKHRRNILFSEVILNGFKVTIRTNRENNPPLQLRKRKSNKIINEIYKQTNIQPKEKGFPKYIMRYSFRKNELSRSIN
jgi:hypothetical protein